MTRTVVTYVSLALVGLLCGFAVAQVGREARESVEIAHACVAGWADAIALAETCVATLEDVQRADTTCACMAPVFVEVQR